MKKKLFASLASLFMAFGLSSCATDGKTPFIGDNGNWWIGDSDTGVLAVGQDGKTPHIGSNGNWWIGDSDAGVTAVAQDGKSVTVTSVTKTATNGLIDTYTISFSDGTTATFTVTNGESSVIEKIELSSSSALVDTYTITFTNGSKKTFTVTNGKDGDDLTITSIGLESSEGLIDTYKIRYSDGSEFTFVVSNGADGKTPYIGDNGNWWIGDEDTGVLADWEKANNVPLTLWSNGLTYSTMTVCGKSGYVVTGWNEDYIEDRLIFDFVANGMTFEEARDHLAEVLANVDDGGVNLVIPNYIGSVPVIGVNRIPNEGFETVTLSRNTVWLGNGAFENCSSLKNIDFNNSKVTQIPMNCFKNTSLEDIELPSSVNVINDYAFSGVKMDSFDFSGIGYIGSSAFDSLKSSSVYLPNTVNYVGSGAFASARVYLEHETYPDTWPSVITSSNAINGRVSTNCQKDDEYIYSVENDEVTVYQYLGQEKTVYVPSTIEDKPVTKIGYGFGSPTSVGIIQVNGYEDVDDYISIEEVILPEGVTEIDDYALCNIGMTIFAPSSLETVSETVIMAICDMDDIIGLSVNGKETVFPNNYLALAGNDLPTVIDEGSHEDIGLTKAGADSMGCRIGYGINHSEVESDDSFYYINEGTHYSLMSYKGLKTNSLSVPSTFNEKPVLTILRNAISYDSRLTTITIEDGITTIRPFGIVCYEVEQVIVPLSVLLINANGIYSHNNKMKIYVYASSKPIDWDSNWTNVSGNVVFGISGDIYTNNFFTYCVSNSLVTLMSYDGKSSNVYIPSEIDGMPVVAIKSGFYKRNGGAEIHIPSSVTTIEERAFVNSSSMQFEFKLEDSSKPNGWNDNWYYGTYNNSNSSCVKKTWADTSSFNYSYDEDFAYLVNGQAVTLLSHHCKNRTTEIPRTIEGKAVNKIVEYCFYYETSATVYIPQEITTIEAWAFEHYSSSSDKTLSIRCEVNSRPSGWNSYFASNSYYSYSNQSYISIQYGCQLHY